MTRYAIFSDVHANLEALEAVLLDIDKRGISNKNRFCLGDIVGYGPNPGECIDRIQLEEIPSVAGNHDLAVSSEESSSLSIYTGFASKSIIWTREQLRKEDKEFLRNLPGSIQIRKQTRKFTLVHGYLVDFEDGNINKKLKSSECYILTPFDKKREKGTIPPEYVFEQMDDIGTDICFVGHSHVSWVLEETKLFHSFKSGKYQIEYDGHINWLRGKAPNNIIVNAGSVGQPRDKNPKAAYVIFDSWKGTFELRRVDYNFFKTAAKIRKTDLPAILAARLKVGE